jgi:hypothetical protein
LVSKSPISQLALEKHTFPEILLEEDETLTCSSVMYFTGWLLAVFCLAVPLLSTVPVVRASSAQQRAFDEAAWTRATWNDYKLELPLRSSQPSDETRLESIRSWRSSLFGCPVIYQRLAGRQRLALTCLRVQPRQVIIAAGSPAGYSWMAAIMQRLTAQTSAPKFPWTEGSRRRSPSRCA